MADAFAVLPEKTERLIKMSRKTNPREIISGLIADIAGSIFSSVGIYIFAGSSGFAVGGVSGLALLANHLFKIPVGTAIVIINIPLIIFSYRFVGRRFLLRSLRSMLFCMFFLDFVFPYFPAYSGSKLLAALYSGVFIGTGLATFYMNSSSSGGTDFITMSVKSVKPYLSIGFVTMTIDLVIISLGFPVFGDIEAVLYGLISTFVTSVVIDKLMYRVGAAKLLIIVTENGRETAKKISEICERGSTIISAAGAYTGNAKNILLCACSKSQVYIIKKAAMEIDDKSFIILTDANEIFGEGFLRKNA